MNKEVVEAGSLRNVSLITSSPIVLQLWCMLCVLCSSLVTNYCRDDSRLQTDVWRLRPGFRVHCGLPTCVCFQSNILVSLLCYLWIFVFFFLWIYKSTLWNAPRLQVTAPAVCVLRCRSVTNSSVLYAALLAAGRLIKLSAERLKLLVAPEWPRRKRSKLNSV